MMTLRRFTHKLDFISATTALVEAVVAAFPGQFTLASSNGRGPGAAWQRKGNTRKRGQ